MALKDLIKSTDKLEDSLESILKGRVDLVKMGEEKSIKMTKELLKKLDNVNKVLLYLAGKRAWSLIDGTEYWAKPKELEANLFMPGGSVRPILMKLKKEKFVEFNRKEKEYRITSLGILELENLLQKYEEKQKK